MIKVLSTDQIRRADEYTIENEPISSYELMERASEAFVSRFLELFPEKKEVRIFCGVGNNGGDGLAIGRILKEKGWQVLKYIIGNPRKGTDDFKVNLEKSDLYAVITSADDLPQIGCDEIIIDALFGSGLSREVEGVHKEAIAYLNEQSGTRVSVDIPSGLYSDKPVEKEAVVFSANHTISFQVPKLVFLLPEYHEFVGEWHLVDIGLSERFIEKESSTYYFSGIEDMVGLIPLRDKYTHKNKVGKLTVVAGSKGKMGAAVLASRAALRTGVGLINVCCPKVGTSILQTSVPEAMVLESDGTSYVSKIPDLEYTIVLGPGLGTNSKTIQGVEELLRRTNKPMVIDADGINILSKKKKLLKLLPENSILTPHPGEFKRLIGAWENDFEKLEMLSSFCKSYCIHMVLKGAYSAVCNADGEIFFNSSGNPVLATAGSGDVLSGIVGAFLANGLASFEALKLGAFVHGYCGDLLSTQSNAFGVIASDIVDSIPTALSEISNKFSI